MACNMVLAMKGLAPSQKEERGLELKKMLPARTGWTSYDALAVSCTLREVQSRLGRQGNWSADCE